MIGTARLLFTFGGVSDAITVRISPRLNDSYVLDTDFVTIFGLVIDAKSGKYGWRIIQSLSMPTILNSMVTSIPVGVSRCLRIPRNRNLRPSLIRLFGPNLISYLPLRLLNILSTLGGTRQLSRRITECRLERTMNSSKSLIS